MIQGVAKEEEEKEEEEEGEEEEWWVSSAIPNVWDAIKVQGVLITYKS